MAKRGRKPRNTKAAAATSPPNDVGNGDGLPLGDYRHAATRKNNPPAKIAAEGTVPAIPKATYAYNPHLPPVLRFDADGKPDALPELLAKARTGPLSDDEARTLAAALRIHEPWLEWTGKREKKWFEVDPVALHIHERISTQAILKVAARQDVQRSLFADPQQDYHEAVQFYRHDVDWANRLILGDSLQVMSSLARREDLAGKVQMIYMDPPYGIKFASNFQPEVGKRDVKDKEQDLTRETEMVRAYRDTWHLGIHSYLSYLRDRLIVARELLADTGSIFVQISDENLHTVRLLLDEVFGTTNFIGLIQFLKTTSATNNFLPSVADYVLWYSRNKEQTKYIPVYRTKALGLEGAEHYSGVLLPSGEKRMILPTERDGTVPLPVDAKAFTASGLESASMGREKGEGAACWFPVHWNGTTYTPNAKSRWKTNEGGLRRLLGAERVLGQKTALRYSRFIDDFSAFAINSMWADVGGAQDRVYVVQTSGRVIERCILMTTDPGDIVLDPTCGSGTTANVAEQWGRRWITIDTSRVAVAIARQRLLTAKYEMYRTKATEPQSHAATKGDNPADGFMYKTVPHITLKSVAQNVALDPIFARHEPILDKALAECNAALAKVKDDLRIKLCAKLAEKAAKDGTRAASDADTRRWLLPGTSPKMLRDALETAFAATKRKLTPAQRKDFEERIPRRAEVGPSSVPENGVGWEHWQVPFDSDDDWPAALREAVTAYRKAWRAKMDEVNACIAASAEQEELVDQPEIVRGVTRVSGPFTVEAVQPPEMTLGDNIDPYTESLDASALGASAVRATPGPPLPLGEGRGEGYAEPGMFDGAPESLPDGFEPRSLRMVEPKHELEVANVTAYLEQMFRYLKADGVRFLNNKQMKFTRLEPLFESGRAGIFHAEGRWVPVGDVDPDPEGPGDVGVIFGPQYGPFTAKMVEEVIKPAGRKYDHLVIAAFNFTGEATAILSEKPAPQAQNSFRPRPPRH